MTDRAAVLQKLIDLIGDGSPLSTNTIVTLNEVLESEFNVGKAEAKDMAKQVLDLTKRIAELEQENERLQESVSEWEGEDDRTYMADRCHDCGHRFRSMASHCAQCGVAASRYEPEVYPDVCGCERCEDARDAGR